MKILVYDSETGKERQTVSLGKIRYVGESFGANSLTNNKIYDVIEIDREDMFLVVDDSGEAYLYSMTNPAPLDGENVGGIWELVEDYNGKLLNYL